MYLHLLLYLHTDTHVIETLNGLVNHLPQLNMANLVKHLNENPKPKHSGRHFADFAIANYIFWNENVRIII